MEGFAIVDHMRIRIISDGSMERKYGDEHRE